MQHPRNPLDPSLRERIALAPTLWRLTCDLLAFWRASGVRVAPNGDTNAARYDMWDDLLARTEDRFGDARAADEITPADRHALLAWTGTAKSVPDAVHAMAWGLSVVAAHAFAPAWRDELGSKPVTLKRGDFYPVADAPWVFPDGLELSSRPPALNRPRAGELPSIRVHSGEFDATVDTSLERPLEAVSVGLTRAAGGHPNRDWGEIAIPDGARLVFPVAPADPRGQLERLTELVGRAQAERVAVLVLPELCTTAQAVNALAKQVRSFEDPQLVIAGSHHVIVDGQPENVAVGLLAGTEGRMRQVKNAPFSDELRHGHVLKEGIRARKRIELTVYPADRYRYAITICKDLLDESVRRAYDRMGVNVLLVPALSEKTHSFRDAVAARVLSAQALTVVVNGPLYGPTGKPVQPAIVVGQPVAGATVAAPPVAGEVGLTIFELPFVEGD